MMKQLLQRMRLQNLWDSPGLRQKLAQAGKRGQAAAITFAFFRVVMPVLVGLGTFAFLMMAKGVDWSTTMRILAAVAAGVIGFYLPNVIMSNMIQKRQKALQKSFPDALDLLVICVEAGLSVEASFHRVADEMADSAPELAEEFGLTNAELAFLNDRRQAFENLSWRTGLPATKSLATSLLQSEKYGTPVSVSLRVLSEENRDERMSRAEKKAGALPAQLTVPMIAFFLPVLFIVILAPAVIKATSGGG